MKSKVDDEQSSAVHTINLRLYILVMYSISTVN